ncbi:MAG: Na+/H+ antiporter NhaA [Planctomycetes bacterium]|nr:Na+/H+ antiporter NhaA [Planctomycetota bacterium]
MSRPKKFVRILQEFSLPLLVGVLGGLLAANMAPEWYASYFADHHGTLPFIINNVFMAFFFGIAAKEITEAALPGGSLNPMKKAMNPLFATLGGVFGPIGAFVVVIWLQQGAGEYTGTVMDPMRGWGIPTATDIALAWLVARAVFGPGHPAINFLLLLAIADDAIGLGIIAIFYGDPANPTNPAWLGLVGVGMVVAYFLRRMQVSRWQVYIFIAGPISWAGFTMAHLHSALALVPIVPFLPGPKRDTGMFVDSEAGVHHEEDHSPLHSFEHELKLFVDLGLFFFAFANSGVQFAGIGPMTVAILVALVVGKTVGVMFFGWLAVKLGFPLPTGMGYKDLGMVGLIAAIGLTVALFVAGAAFPTDPDLLGQAKMGALFSGVVGLLAVGLGRVFGFKKGA